MRTALHTLTSPGTTPEYQMLVEGLCIRAQPRQPYVQLVVDLVGLGAVRGHGLQLHAEAKVTADGHAVLARHGDDGSAIVLKNRHFKGIWRLEGDRKLMVLLEAIQVSKLERFNIHSN